VRLTDLVDRACGRRPHEPVLSDAARASMQEGGRALAAAADAGQVYGLTTGVGALRDVALDDRSDQSDQGLRLWRSHAAAFGPELEDADARATMAVRLHQLATGSTGVSVELAEALERALVSGAVPVLHGYGSIGTGDLTVLAQLGLALVGEGPWRAGSPAPTRMRPSDALPFLSSNAMTAGVGVLVHDDLSRLLGVAEQVAAISFLALRGSAQAYDERVFAGQADPAAAAAADRMRNLLAGAASPSARVQDPFALRTIPQVHGVAAAALDAAGSALLAEIHAPGENPLPVDGTALHHGQFLTQRLAAAFDAVRSSYVGVTTLAQTRLAALVDPRLTELPAFLADGAAGSSGVMILEYVAADLGARLRATALPTTLTRTSLSIGMEETASHSTQGVLGARAVGDLVPDLLACELLAATRALRMAPDRVHGNSVAAQLARAAIGALGDASLDDHVLGEELQAAAGLVRAWADATTRP
jgi:histidine ammonia-lyase